MWQARRVVAWIALGATASLLELGLLRLLYEGLGWTLPVATAVAAEVLILVKFVMNDRFVFGYAWPSLARLIRYHGASAGALLVYWLVLNGLNVFAGLPYVPAFILGTGSAFAWSFLTNFFWVWGRSVVACFSM